VACNTGYSKPTLTGNFTTCTSNNATINIGSCAINTCKVPSTAVGYALPFGVTYYYTTNPITIEGASCDSGHSGTPQYTCNSDSVTSPTRAHAILSGCNANCSANLSNATVNSYQHNGTATCNKGYSSSLGATNPTCNNGTWSGICYKKCNALTNAYDYYPSGQTGNYNHGTIAHCTNSNYHDTIVICQNGLWYLDNNGNGRINAGENTQIVFCN
jgi:hypothetical protein